MFGSRADSALVRSSALEATVAVERQEIGPELAEFSATTADGAERHVFNQSRGTFSGERYGLFHIKLVYWFTLTYLFYSSYIGVAEWTSLGR